MKKYLSKPVQKIIIFNLFCCWSAISFASDADTLLNLVISKPVFYNVIQNGQGEVYAGTADGIYKIEGEAISQFDRQSGYIRFNRKGKPEIDSSGISNHESFQYLHLLPYPDEKRQVYHTGTAEQFYMVSGGRLYMFDIVPYGVSYKNQSIRSISKHLVGGYSGVYQDGRKLEFPTFTDGFIREFGDTAFICYGGLFRITPKTQDNYLSEVPFGALIDGENLGYIDDIYYDAPHAAYVISSQTGVYVLGIDLKKVRKILSIHKREPIVLLGSKESFLFTVGGKIFSYSFDSDRLSSEDSTGEQILSGVKISNRLLYTLSATSLYQTATNTFFHKIATFHDVHTMVALNEKEVVIAGNQGLYLYSTESSTTAVLIPGVEFNKRALFTDGQKLYAGSVSGLYTIDLKQLPKLIQRNKGKVEANNYGYFIFGAITLLLTSVFGGAIFHLNRKLKTAEQIIQETKTEQLPVEEKMIDKEKIVEFIRLNLPTASLKSINEHFGSNTNQVYALFDPEKPGTIIQQIRTELVIAMKKEKASLAEIATATGFSQSYIKKIKLSDG